MCEVITTCARVPQFFVAVDTVPQSLGPDGKYGVESSPAGRSILACSAHLARSVRHLNALSIRTYGAAVEVRCL